MGKHTTVFEHAQLLGIATTMNACTVCLDQKNMGLLLVIARSLISKLHAHFFALQFGRKHGFSLS